MEQFGNNDLEYVVDGYYDVVDFSDDDVLEETMRTTPNFEYLDGEDGSDLDDDDFFDSGKAKTDTSAKEARKGKDIQGIPWERLNFTRDKYRETRLRQYKNYENLSLSRHHLLQECLDVEKGKTFYDFQFNTRLVKSTIVHFQECYVSLFFSLISMVEVISERLARLRIHFLWYDRNKICTFKGPLHLT